MKWPLPCLVGQTWRLARLSLSRRQCEGLHFRRQLQDGAKTLGILVVGGEDGIGEA